MSLLGFWRARKPIALALQGGGSHGAFTWGVLDRLLEDERLEITAVSGASAGAMNGVVLASGLLAGGRDGAREALAILWHRVSEAGRLVPFSSNAIADLMEGELGRLTPVGIALQLISQVASPYQLNPLDLNPLRQLMEDLVDFDRLRRSAKVELFVSATNLHTGGPRIFTTREMTSDVLLASACLPSIHRAVEIDGAHYWDGGFTANPAIFPLVRTGRSRDIVIVHIETQGHPDLPVTTNQISSRLQRILTNAPLLREMEMIAELQATAGGRRAFGRRLRRLSLHHVLPPKSMAQLRVSSKLDTEWSFLTGLRDMGRGAAQVWLEENFDRLGTGTAPTLETSLLGGSLDATGNEVGYSAA